METIAEIIVNHLQPLIGLQLTIARRGADMRGFHFGPIRKVATGTVGDYALHIQCPWRIEGQQGIITGRTDLWEPPDFHPGMDWEPLEDYEKGNLQDKQIGALLGGYDSVTRSYMNQTTDLYVETVQADDYGGAIIGLSGGYRLVLFPAGSADSEDWRIFGTGDETHFVVSGGKIE